MLFFNFYVLLLFVAFVHVLLYGLVDAHVCGYQIRKVECFQIIVFIELSIFVCRETLLWNLGFIAFIPVFVVQIDLPSCD